VSTAAPSTVASTAIGPFLEALGSRTPSPGGGATAALTAALGAAQLKMVAEYVKWEAGAPDPRAELGRIAQELAGLAQRDADAYAAYSAANKRKAEDPAAFEREKAAILEVPVAMLETCLAALRHVEPVLPRAPQWFVCDLAIAVGCLRTAFDGAYGLTAANLKPHPPTTRHPVVGDRVIAARAEFDRLRRELDPRLLARLGGG
jgi:formiminotetrahydrofolate cyclodeaminase